MNPASETLRVNAVEAVLGAIAVHAGQQDFTGAQRSNLFRPLDGVQAGVVAAAMRKHVPRSGATCLASMATTMHCEPTFAGSVENQIGIL